MAQEQTMMKIRLQRQRRSTATFLLRSLCGLLCAAVAAACSEGTGPRPGSWTSLTAGIAHTCGLTSGGAAYCWGLNVSGGLGDGSTADRGQITPCQRLDLIRCEMMFRLR